MSEFEERCINAGVDDVRVELERGRECYARRAWVDAYHALSLVDRAAPLDGADLELLAMSAYLLGRDDDYLSALDRAHRAYLDSGEQARAVRCAFWLGLRLLFRGQAGQASGWLARARRLLENQQREYVEEGYLLLPVVQQHAVAGDGRSRVRRRGSCSRDRRALRGPRPYRLRPPLAGAGAHTAGAG